MPHHRNYQPGSVASSPMSGIIDTSNTPSQYEYPKSHLSWCNSAQSDPILSLGSPFCDASTQIISTPTSDDAPHYPHSPPPLDHWKSPYSTIPLPAIKQQIHLNPILRRQRFPSIIWDLLSPVQSAQCTIHSTTPWRDVWACTPAQHSLVVRSSLIDRPVVVFSDEHTFVTVGDVLEAISRAIRLVDRGRSSLFDEQIPGDAVRLTEPRLLIGLGMADHQFEDSDQSGGASLQTGNHARAMLWGGLVKSPTEREVWILCVH